LEAFVNRRSLRVIVALSGVAVVTAAMASPASAAGPATLTETAGTAALATAQTTLRASLGDTFANSWLDGTSGELVVGITDPARSAQVRAAGAVPKVRRHSATDLATIQSTLDRRAGSVPASVTGWYVDAPANEVVVTLLGDDAAGRAWIGAAPVRVEQVAKAPRPLWDVVGGQELYFATGRCSVGFNAYNDADVRFVITAGHCTNLGGTVSGVGGTIGKVAKSSFPDNDYGTIRVTQDSASTPPRVDRYDDGSDVRIDGTEVVPVNGRVCRSGSTTGWECGRVLALGQTVNYGEGNLVHGLTQTDACAEPGDSGGSFVSRPTAGSGTKLVQAQGLTSGGSGNCDTGGTTYFQPIEEVLQRYDLTLETN
jgi:streptogrisin C